MNAVTDESHCILYANAPSRRLQRMQGFFMKMVTPSTCFFFSSGPKNVRSLSLDVKCEQQTHKEKTHVSNYGINLKKIIQQSPILILSMFLAGGLSHKIEAFFAGRFYGFGLWGVATLWGRVLGVKLVNAMQMRKRICITNPDGEHYVKRGSSVPPFMLLQSIYNARFMFFVSVLCLEIHDKGSLDQVPKHLRCLCREHFLSIDSSSGPVTTIAPRVCAPCSVLDDEKSTCVRFFGVYRCQFRTIMH